MCEQIESEIDKFVLVSLFKGMSTFGGYLMPKLSLLKNSAYTILPIAWG